MFSIVSSNWFCYRILNEQTAKFVQYSGKKRQELDQYKRKISDDIRRAWNERVEFEGNSFYEISKEYCLFEEELRKRYNMITSLAGRTYVNSVRELLLEKEFEVIQQAKAIQQILNNQLTQEDKGRDEKFNETTKHVGEVGGIIQETITNKISEDFTLDASEILLDIQQKMMNNSPFIDELRSLRRITSKDPLLSFLTNGISNSVATKGVSTKEKLVNDFKQIKDFVRSEAFKPDPEANIINRFVAKIVAALPTPYVEGLVQGTDPDAILARTEFYLNNGNLKEAMEEMNQFTGLGRKASKDWVNAVEEYLTVKTTFSLINTHLVNLVQSRT